MDLRASMRRLGGWAGSVRPARGGGINFVARRDNLHTIETWLPEWAPELRVRVFDYESLPRPEALPSGLWIFADVDRLTPVCQGTAMAAWDGLNARHGRHVRLLNRPGTSLSRKQLLDRALPGRAERFSGPCCGGLAGGQAVSGFPSSRHRTLWRADTAAEQPKRLARRASGRAGAGLSARGHAGGRIPGHQRGRRIPQVFGVPGRRDLHRAACFPFARLAREGVGVGAGRSVDRGGPALPGGQPAFWPRCGRFSIWPASTTAGSTTPCCGAACRPGRSTATRPSCTAGRRTGPTSCRPRPGLPEPWRGRCGKWRGRPYEGRGQNGRRLTKSAPGKTWLDPARHGVISSQ